MILVAFDSRVRGLSGFFLRTWGSGFQNKFGHQQSSSVSVSFESFQN
jgi:hypothetical protein